MNLIDTHSHLTFDELAGQLDEVLARSIEAGVTRWITVGISVPDNEKVLHLISQHENLFAALGYHPHDAKDISDADMDLLKKQAHHAKVLAVGECGLDYHYMNSPAEKQQSIFRGHLDIAVEINKPVVIHTRDAFDETMAILDEYTGRLKGVVIHCFGGDQQQTQRVLDKGYFISFTGTVTFPRSEELREVAKMIPLDRLMIETDCPFISPHPKRNTKPNEPALLVHTAQCLADVHGISLEEFAQKITKTSETFFDLK
ncbi:MAG: TatD family hydrolase [Planctomycetes bacterium]|nr:TatD family hydrolase [Planctomycetota bacterium]